MLRPVVRKQLLQLVRRALTMGILHKTGDWPQASHREQQRHQSRVSSHACLLAVRLAYAARHGASRVRIVPQPSGNPKMHRHNAAPRERPDRFPCRCWRQVRSDSQKRPTPPYPRGELDWASCQGIRLLGASPRSKASRVRSSSSHSSSQSGFCNGMMNPRLVGYQTFLVWCRFQVRKRT